jgi:hypothetical protein
MVNRFSPGCRCEPTDPGQLVAGACNWRIPSDWNYLDDSGATIGEVSITVPNIPGQGGGGTYIVPLKGTVTNAVAGFVQTTPSGGFYYRVDFQADWSTVFGLNCQFDATLQKKAVGSTGGVGISFRRFQAGVDWRNVNTLNAYLHTAGPATWFAIP